ncbi:MAG: hypothetical protein MZV63_59990 [Marinilabiliales bacterium]|nr:hypothetical protein [Marinilabiliales bacterium]
MVLNGKLTSGIIFLAVGTWFILPDINPEHCLNYVKIRLAVARGAGSAWELHI